MSADRIVSRLAVAASVLFVVALAATVTAVAWPRVAHALGIKPAPVPPAYSAGDKIDVPADWYDDADRTLVVFARASCGACQTAQPFLKALFEVVRPSGGVILSGSGREQVADAEYGRALGLPEVALKTTPAGLRVRATPTLVWVDRTGKILAAWEGVGPETKQAEIRAAILASR